MTTELCFHNRKIPVSFISSDQKAIPRLISVLENTRACSENADSSYLNQIERIEVIGNNAILHRSEESECIQLPLY